MIKEVCETPPKKTVSQAEFRGIHNKIAAIAAERSVFIMENTNHAIPGIMCSVEQCAYHAQDNKCTASRIEVGSSASCCSSCDTECVTFKPGK